MAAVVVDVIGTLLPVFDATDAAANGGLSCVVLAQLTRIGQHCLQELNGHNLLTVVFHLVDAGHAYILDYPQMGKIFLSEGHPEAGAFKGGKILHQ